MNKIKEKVIKLYPTLKKLNKEIEKECYNNGECGEDCPFFNTEPDLHQITCIQALINDTTTLIKAMIKDEKAKEKSNA